MSGLDEFVRLSLQADLAEQGGAHGQKGVDYQRHWALHRLIELERSGANDYLFLFEVLQDVAIFDSAELPTKVVINQVKKRERKEWSWGDLTLLKQPKPTSSKTRARSNSKPVPDPLQSPLGKLYAAVLAVSEIAAEGRFISNMGCDLKLSDGSNAATAEESSLSLLPADYKDLLTAALEKLHSQGSTANVSNIYIEKIAIPVDAPDTYLAGVVHDFLLQRSPSHAGQARALVDALLARIGQLGRKTATCRNPIVLVAERGFSRKQFNQSLAELENVPDSFAQLELWLGQMGREGMAFTELTLVRVAASSIYRRRLTGSQVADEVQLIKSCSEWIAANSPTPVILEYCERAYGDLAATHLTFKRSEILAHFILQVLKKCMDLT